MPTSRFRRLGVSLLIGMLLSIVGGGSMSLARAEPARGAPATISAFALADSATVGPVALGVYRPSFPNDLQALDSYAQSSGASLPIVHWYALWGGWKAGFSRADLDVVS